MRLRFLLLTAVLTVVAIATVPAQGGGGTRLDEFMGKLRLNEKTQMPGVRQMFTEAGQQAAPIATEMVQLRQSLLNLQLTGRTADVPAAVDAYAASATKMAAFEAAVFQKVYAQLTPAQQGRTPDAFDFMAGFFQAAPPRAGGRGGRGGE